MSENETVNEKPNEIDQLLPICPYCEHDPFQPMIVPANSMGQNFTIYACADCRKVITMGMVRAAQPPPSPIQFPPGFNPTRVRG